MCDMDRSLRSRESPSVAKCRCSTRQASSVRLPPATPLYWRWPLRPEPSTGAGYQRRSTRGLRQTVRGCPLTSTVDRGDCHSLCHCVAREPVVSDCCSPHAFQVSAAESGEDQQGPRPGLLVLRGACRTVPDVDERTRLGPDSSLSLFRAEEVPQPRLLIVLPDWPVLVLARWVVTLIHQPHSPGQVGGIASGPNPEILGGIIDMAVGLYIQPSGFTPALYDEAIKQLEQAGAGFGLAVALWNGPTVLF
jgi:hypothetical protein